MFIKNKFLMSITLAALVLNSGCTSMRGTRQRNQTREVSESMLLQEQVRRVSGRLDDIQTQIDQLWEEMENSRRSSRSEAKAVAASLEQRTADIEKSISRLESARAADKKEIIDKMSNSITKLLASSGGGSSGRNISEYGVEHTVKRGETLSEIASAYGVGIKTLIEANSLKNPDALRTGQKIFIPE